MTVFTQFIKAERQDEKKPSLSKGNAEEEELINPEMSRGEEGVAVRTRIPLRSRGETSAWLRSLRGALKPGQ